MWVVVLVSGDRPKDTYVYGPFDNAPDAQSFARVMTDNVDPAHAYELGSPMAELLAMSHALRETR